MSLQTAVFYELHNQMLAFMPCDSSMSHVCTTWSFFPRVHAIAPRVRAFAELALKEIRPGGGGDTSLLADKQAFSEFMDKVNERYEP